MPMDAFDKLRRESSRTAHSKAFSKTDFTEDPKKIDIPTFILQWDTATR
jgi:hypothetical protein